MLAYSSHALSHLSHALITCVRPIYIAVHKAVDKWVLGGAEAPPNFCHLYLKDAANSAQHTTDYGV